MHAAFERDAYADYYFKAPFVGEPENMEPDKCEEVRWAAISELEGRIVEKVAHALGAIERGFAFSQSESTN